MLHVYYNKISMIYTNGHSALIVKYNIGLKTFCNRACQNPFYGDLVYLFKIIIVKPNFSDQFKKIFKRYMKV